MRLLWVCWQCPRHREFSLMVSILDHGAGCLPSRDCLGRCARRRRSFAPAGAFAVMATHHDGRYRTGGVLDRLRGKPVVPGASASAEGRAPPVDLRDAVRHVGDPFRYLRPNDAGRRHAGNPRRAVFMAIEATAPLTPFQCLHGRVLIALDGTGHHGWHPRRARLRSVTAATV
jgi:hypothetical protein